MEKDNDQKKVGAPMVDVSDQLPKKNIPLEEKDGIIGFARKRFINEFEQHARTNQQEYQYDSHTPETPRERQLEGSIRHGPGPKVQDQAVEKPSIAPWILHWALCTRKNGVTDALKEG
jgi:hypothetical protein